ncbi:DUF4169 family protein [Parvibaculum sp.]|uniref:DUF4169 family protein n=1 Tax=Parvibaculum sp. TaxID=2024848 RepID=UPI002CD19FF9|nr:DUF4169 family protein [Parvibaculum sp.]HUD50262.1 DUF4169 family protein [Parvibaculum sp.]
MVSDGGNIVDLSRLRKTSKEQRKRREREEKEARAAANRVRFGRTGAEKKLAKTEESRIRRLHESHRRDHPTRIEGEDKPPEDDRG